MRASPLLDTASLAASDISNIRYPPMNDLSGGKCPRQQILRDRMTVFRMGSRFDLRTVLARIPAWRMRRATRCLPQVSPPARSALKIRDEPSVRRLAR